MCVHVFSIISERSKYSYVFTYLCTYVVRKLYVYVTLCLCMLNCGIYTHKWIRNTLTLTNMYHCMYIGQHT